MTKGILGKGLLALIATIVILPEADAASRRGALKLLIPRFSFKIDPATPAPNTAGDQSKRKSPAAPGSPLPVQVIPPEENSVGA